MIDIHSIENENSFRIEKIGAISKTPSWACAEKRIGYAELKGG
jgi:hypothetical protein